MSDNAHPMREYRKGSKKGFSFSYNRLKNPFTEQIKDPRDLANQFFNELKAIPYAKSDTTTNDRLLKLLNRMKIVSKTLGACWFSIKSFALGSALTPVRRVDLDFDLGVELEPLSQETIKGFAENVLQKIKFGKKGAKNIAENCFDDHFDNGNYYLEVVLSETEGEKGALIDYHHSENVKKLWTDSDIDKYAINPNWDSRFKLEDTRVLPHYPYFTNEKNGVRRTLIHCMQGNYAHYGRPIYLSAMLSGFRQGQDDDYLIKAADKMWVGSGILEYEADDPDYGDGEDNNNIESTSEPNLMDRIDRHLSADSDRDDQQSMLVMERPRDATPFKFTQVKPNTQEGFLKQQSEEQRRSIFEMLGWSERLLGNSIGGAFAADSFMSELKIKDKGVLRFYRNKTVEGLNKAIEIIDRFLTGGKYQDVSLAFKPLFDDTEDLKLDDAKTKVDLIGVGVRAGVITPTKTLEEYVRNLVKVPEMAEEAIQAWEDDGNVRRPITLKGQDELEDEAAITKEKRKEEEIDD